MTALVSAVHSCGGAAAAVRASRQQCSVTCDFCTNELRLSPWRARDGLTRWFYQANTVKNMNTWRKLNRCCRVGGCWERRQPQQGRSSRAPSIIQPPSNAQLTWLSLTGCCEPWVGVGNWWEADPAASLLQLQFDGYNAWLLAWASNPDLPSVCLRVGFWLYPMLQTFPKEVHGAKGRYCSHSKFSRLWKDADLTSLSEQSKIGLFLTQPSPGFGFLSLLVRLRHLIQNPHRLFWLFTCFILCDFKLMSGKF